MAITTRAELATAAANWLNRADLTTRILEFIALAEARMNRDPRLRVVDAITRTTLTVAAQFTNLPSDFGRMVNLEDQTSPVQPLEYATPQQMDVMRARTETGEPTHYSIIGNELEVVPVPSDSRTFGIVYFRRIAALSATVTTNWLLDAAPDIYLYATLAESAPYLLNDDRVATWESLYNARADAYRAISEMDQTGESPLVMRGATIP